MKSRKLCASIKKLIWYFLARTCAALLPLNLPDSFVTGCKVHQGLVVRGDTDRLAWATQRLEDEFSATSSSSSSDHHRCWWEAMGRDLRKVSGSWYLDVQRVSDQICGCFPRLPTRIQPVTILSELCMVQWISVPTWHPMTSDATTSHGLSTSCFPIKINVFTYRRPKVSLCDPKTSFFGTKTTGRRRVMTFEQFPPVQISDCIVKEPIGALFI